MAKERDVVVNWQRYRVEKEMRFFFLFKGNGRFQQVYRWKKINGKTEKRKEDESQEKNET